jgi:hypothetical protein
MMYRKFYKFVATAMTVSVAWIPFDGALIAMAASIMDNDCSETHLTLNLMSGEMLVDFWGKR